MVTFIQKEYPGIDLLKYIMALAVVTIHIHALNLNIELPAMVTWFIRSAVPFFFVVSGFFIGRKISALNDFGQSRQYLRKRSKHLFKIFAIWLIIYLPLSIYFYCLNDIPISKSILLYAKSVIFAGESPYAWPLWFIYSLAIVSFLLSCSNRKAYLQTLLFLSVLAYISSNPLMEYGFVPHKIVLRVRLLFGRSLGGGIYILTGIWLYRNFHIFSKTPWLYSLGLIASGAVLSYFRLPFYELVSGLGFAILAFNIHFKASSLWKDLRNQSMWIYYTHMYIIVLLKLAYPDVTVTLFLLYVGQSFLLCMALGYILNRIQKIPSCSMIETLIH